MEEVLFVAWKKILTINMVVCRFRLYSSCWDKWVLFLGIRCYQYGDMLLLVLWLLQLYLHPLQIHWLRYCWQGHSLAFILGVLLWLSSLVANFWLIDWLLNNVMLHYQSSTWWWVHWWQFGFSQRGQVIQRCMLICISWMYIDLAINWRKSMLHWGHWL